MIQPHALHSRLVLKENCQGSVVMAVSFYSQSVGFGQRYSKGSIFGLIPVQDNRPIIHLHEALQKKVLRTALGSCASQAERVMDRH